MNNAEDNVNVIAIDGPAGSGKSTVAKAIARRLDWDYIDTGAMYRCLCLKALRHEAGTRDEQKLVSILNDTDMRMTFEDGGLKVYMDGEDVSEAIRQNRVSKRVSQVAALSEVRDRLVTKQREMGKEGEVVMDGRDIGTVVFPEAKYKFYLNASLEIRAKRRYTQLKQQDQDVDLDSVVEDIKERDQTDRRRSSGPLKAADDATRVDTSDLTVDEVVDRLLQSVDSHEFNGQ